MKCFVEKEDLDALIEQLNSRFNSLEGRVLNLENSPPVPPVTTTTLPPVVTTLPPGTTLPPVVTTPDPNTPQTTYAVGPGQPYPTLGSVPWNRLPYNSLVLVNWKDTPYRERIVVSGKFITVRGVLGPNGERPVISGENATTNSQFALAHPPIEGAGLVTVWKTVASGDVTPSDIVFENLEVRGASMDQPWGYTGADGTAGKWLEGASGFYLLRFDRVTVRNCVVTDCGNGIFTSDSNHCSDLLLEKNQIFGNGKINSNLEHNVYVQCVRPTYKDNDLRALRVGAYGGMLKDRSADVVILGNRIEGGTRMVDLSGWQNETADRQAAPNAYRVIFSGNTLVNRAGGAVDLVYTEARYGAQGPNVIGDNNKFIVRRDDTECSYVRLFRSEYSDTTTFTASRNLVDVKPATVGKTATALRVFDSKGTLTLNTNWAREAPSNYSPIGGVISGWDTWLVGEPGPLYRSEAVGDFTVLISPLPA